MEAPHVEQHVKVHVEHTDDHRPARSTPATAVDLAVDLAVAVVDAEGATATSGTLAGLIVRRYLPKPCCMQLVD